MNAIFRCDATDDIGFGHLSRCIALAEALQMSGIHSTFAGQLDDAAQEQVSIAGFDCVSLDQPVNTDNAERELAGISSAQAANFIVVDSYRVDEHYLAELSALGHATVVIDDFRTLESYPCDVVLNFTWEARSLGYQAGSALLLGPDYLLARRKLVEHRSRSIARRRCGPIQNLLIAIGGSDPKGITARLVRTLPRLGSQICVRAIALNNPELSAMVADFSSDSCILPRQPDLSEQLLWADAAITGGGLIKYESAYMGVPAAAIAQNEGQDRETRVFSRAGLVFDLGLADKLTDEDLAIALDQFISDEELRDDMATRTCETFLPDPTAHAAQSILRALRH